LPPSSPGEVLMTCFPAAQAPAACGPTARSAREVRSVPHAGVHETARPTGRRNCRCRRQLPTAIGNGPHSVQQENDRQRGLVRASSRWVLEDDGGKRRRAPCSERLRVAIAGGSPGRDQAGRSRSERWRGGDAVSMTAGATAKSPFGRARASFGDPGRRKSGGRARPRRARAFGRAGLRPHVSRTIKAAPILFHLALDHQLKGATEDLRSG